eukprot:a174528_784.p2 GENE.a174528_784~~a174528_784.p2  ORF type:complete len:121 (+),score=50.65 a174528_784:37-363(+)
MASMDVDKPKPVKEGDAVAGPLSLLAKAVKQSTQVIIACRNNKKLLARVKAFDRHWNMVLEDVTEMWTEHGKTGKGVKAAKATDRDRFIRKMFLRGDNVIMVLASPHA